MIDEADPILYTDALPPPPEDAATHDLARCMDGREWVHKANRIYTAWAVKEGFVTEYVHETEALTF